MLSPAHKLIAKVTTEIEMFANRKILSLASFTWNIVSTDRFSSRYMSAFWRNVKSCVNLNTVKEL